MGLLEAAYALPSFTPICRLLFSYKEKADCNMTARPRCAFVFICFISVTSWPMFTKNGRNVMPSELTYCMILRPSSEADNCAATPSPSPSHIATDGQSVSQSVLVSSPAWGSWPDFVTVGQLLSCPWEGAFSDERTSLSFVSQSAVLRQLSLCTVVYILHVLHDYNIYTWPLSVRAQYSRLCPISGSVRYYDSLALSLRMP
jgi:hypothetical protein